MAKRKNARKGARKGRKNTQRNMQRNTQINVAAQSVQNVRSGKDFEEIGVDSADFESSKSRSATVAPKPRSAAGSQASVNNQRATAQDNESYNKNGKNGKNGKNPDKLSPRTIKITAYIVAASAILTLVMIIYNMISAPYNVKFASTVHLEYNTTTEDKVSLDVTDVDDIKAFKTLITGHIYHDYTATDYTGYDEKVSIKLQGKDKNLLLLPALDMSPSLRFWNSNEFLALSDENRDALIDLLTKYGFNFPVDPKILEEEE